MRKFGLIGDHLPHSFSARYFAEKFEREGIRDCKYSLYELPSIEALEELLLTPDLAGFNVTLPYKRDVMRYLDSVSQEAAAIGAVNCVKIDKDGKLYGYNTDIMGLRNSMLDFLAGYRPNKAIILGTGGAAASVRYLLSELGIEYEVVSRTSCEGRISYEEVTDEMIRSTELIVNATPLGTYPNVDSAPAIRYDLLTPSHYLFDLVYNPPLTKFLAQGEARGAKICNGQAMLIGQAEEAWRIWNE